jgi:hypothetical protein
MKPGDWARSAPLAQENPSTPAVNEQAGHASDERDATRGWDPHEVWRTRVKDGLEPTLGRGARRDQAVLREHVVHGRKAKLR